MSAIEKVWTETPLYNVKKLLASMRKWCVSVLKTKDGITKY